MGPNQKLGVQLELGVLERLAFQGREPGQMAPQGLTCAIDVAWIHPDHAVVLATTLP